VIVPYASLAVGIFFARIASASRIGALSAAPLLMIYAGFALDQIRKEVGSRHEPREN